MPACAARCLGARVPVSGRRGQAGRGDHALTHILVDALSVNNLSGRHVLLGHLRELAAADGERRFTLLAGTGNESLLDELPPGVVGKRASVGSAWLQRVSWQLRHGARLCRDLAVDIVFTPAGMLSVGMPRPQVVLAQNPWPMLDHGPGADALKSSLQRRAFARAQDSAAVMAYNSRFMLDLYAQRFGQRASASVVAHQGIDDSLFSAGHQVDSSSPREPTLLCVSVMARHKAVEVLVDAFVNVARATPSARLILVGAWPDHAYRREVESRIAQSGVSERIELRGHVDQASLHGLYASARVFCLLSRCESFGIPAVEAQAFGTPSVVAAGTAAPEIVGEGGLTVPQDDVMATARALQQLLVDDQEWLRRSRAARDNASRFHWRACSAPLLHAFERLEQARV